MDDNSRNWGSWGTTALVWVPLGFVLFCGWLNELQGDIDLLVRWLHG